MPPKLRVRGPRKRDSKVTYSKHYEKEEGRSTYKFLVTIKLGKDRLAGHPNIFSDNQHSNEENKRPEPNPIDTHADSVGEEGDDSDSELSSLELELNNALVSSDTTLLLLLKKEPSFNRAAPEASKPVPPPRAAGYRNIPKNLVRNMKIELGIEDEENELEMIERMIFSLKDPFSGSKIKLPVKSTHCRHFECFDFESLCIINKIPVGVQRLLKKDLAKRNLEWKKTEKMLQSKYQSKGPTAHQEEGIYGGAIKIVEFPLLGRDPEEDRKPQSSKVAKPKAPSYRCPVCNCSFYLSNLFISDVFNYFVKTTPSQIVRIELQDMDKYRIIDDSTPVPASHAAPGSTPDVVVLSDDDSGPPPTALWPTQIDTAIQPSDDVFDDGLDDELIRLSTTNDLPDPDYMGHGTWDDPVTLD